MFVYLMHANSTKKFPHVDRVLLFSNTLSAYYFCVTRQDWENQGGE